jgi:hypothetical protein
MRLRQGQIWKCGDEYVRIVRLERLEVSYKSASDLKFTDGRHEHTSKKDFCRLLKGATLLSPSGNVACPSELQVPEKFESVRSITPSPTT